MGCESLIFSIEEMCRSLEDWQTRLYEMQFGLPASMEEMDWAIPTFQFQGFVPQKRML
jgi:hypothetical protein